VTFCPPVDVFEEGCTLWQSTIVGHFVGPKLPFPVLYSDNGFFIFSFDSVEHASTILNYALWHMVKDIRSLEDGRQTCNSLKLSYPEFLFGLSFIMFP